MAASRSRTQSRRRVACGNGLEGAEEGTELRNALGVTLEVVSTPYLLWLGSVLVPDDALDHPAMSPAANRWQAGLIAALSKRVPVHVIGHVPERLWPRGPALVGRYRRGTNIVRNEHVPYLNMPAVRPLYLAGAYQQAVRRHVQRFGAPAAVLAYNDSPWNIAAAKRLAAWQVPWISVVADGPGEGRALELHEMRINQAAGRVFLSYGRYRDSRARPALHLDGGVDVLPTDTETPQRPPGQPRVVLFSGSMNRLAGATQLIEAFRRVRHRDAELWLCGHGRNMDVVAAAARDKRVRLLGLLSEAELARVQDQADVFVNPRPPELPDNRSNFPSKLLEYLTWGRPVVSTWTDGLAPEYAAVLRLARSASPADLAATIEAALGMSEDERLELAGSIRAFLTGSRLWSRQASRLMDWLVGDVGIKPLLRGK
jgi:glycosyltransferase involved in cell wall biosynthesis